MTSVVVPLSALIPRFFWLFDLSRSHKDFFLGGGGGGGGGVELKKSEDSW